MPSVFLKPGFQNLVPSKYLDFVCPDCGSTNYLQIIKENGIVGFGAKRELDYCKCKSCGVEFLDAEKFSK